VHLRGLTEISNHCVRQCGYCGLRAGNSYIERYRMNKTEIMECAGECVRREYGTIVLQAGEDYGIKTPALSNLIQRIKAETPLAVTLSMGERPLADLSEWRNAGADRYLLRFETSDRHLYELIHPAYKGRKSDRIVTLRVLKSLGYEIGGGVMVGIPGQTYESLARDIEIFRELDLDMIGIGPYLPHPQTPLGRGEWKRNISEAEQAPNDEETTLKMFALSRIACPEANIPATTALATLNPQSGIEAGLMRGANVLMPDLTPQRFRNNYQIYPDRQAIHDSHDLSLRRRLENIDRRPGVGPGGRFDRLSEIIAL